MTFTVESVAANLRQVRERIASVGGAAAVERVRIVAVTKGFTRAAVDAAAAAGCMAVGENYAQEVVAKFADDPRPHAVEVRFIGQLQSNKVRQLAAHVDVYETLDRPSLVTELARRAPGARVLVQVDTTGEPGKGGCAVGSVGELVEMAGEAGLVVEGLMTVGPTSGGPEEARAGFAAVRALVDRFGLTVCSMGMSDDLEVAVAEGTTEVRIGTALFGARPPR